MTAKPLTILVVDDEPAIRRALERALARWGHKVHLAGSGEGAIELLATYSIDLILLDLRMPSMSGQTVFHSVVARWPQLVRRLIVMTGDPEAEEHHDWLKLHQLPILWKPFELAQLQSLVETVAAKAEEEEERNSGA